MSGDEVFTRLGQETSKRLDVAIFRAGLNGSHSFRTAKVEHDPIFFFDREALTRRVDLLRRHLPEDVNAIIVEADDICRHKFRLLGYEALDYGPEIDWHLDAVHHKRAPLKPWYKIRFLDFSEVGDHKVTWELNRHKHLVTLAKAWCFTSETEYASELVNQWYSWRKANPYPLGINWASALEIALRSLSWTWIKRLLADCPDLPSNFHCDVLAGLRQHGRFIRRYHSKYFSPNTHLLGEAVALFWIGTLCPEIPEAQDWQQWGWETVLTESGRQVRPDGVYFEQSLYYHVYALDLFLYARALAARNGIVIPEKFDDVLVRMLNFVYTLGEGAPLEGFGDDDGGRLFNPRRNRVEHMTDPLALGAVEYNRQDWGTAAGLTEEAVWLFGDEAVAISNADDRDLAPPNTAAFESGGVYLIRDKDPVQQQMMIDAGPQGADTCGHGHADALSIRLSINGRRCLVDPGSYVYISPGDDRERFRGTAAHNTLRIDGLDQAIPRGPFGWDSIPTTNTRQWLVGESFTLFEGEHDGYSRLSDPVLHRRMIFQIKGWFWLVRDIAEGKTDHDVESFWHFSPEFQISQPSENSIVAAPTTASDAGNKFVMLIADPKTWKAETKSTEISPAYGVKLQAPMVRIYARIQLPAEYAVLLVPHVRDMKSAFEEIENSEASKGLHVYRYSQGATTHLVFFSEGATPWTLSSWSSDARLLYCRIEEGYLTGIVGVGSTFAKCRDRDLMSRLESEGYFERIYAHGEIALDGAGL